MLPVKPFMLFLKTDEPTHSTLLHTDYEILTFIIIIYFAFIIIIYFAFIMIIYILCIHYSIFVVTTSIRSLMNFMFSSADLSFKLGK
jgi:hypothetical protein